MFASSLIRTKKVAFSFSTDVFSKLYESVTVSVAIDRIDLNFDLF